MADISLITVRNFFILQYLGWRNSIFQNCLFCIGCFLIGKILQQILRRMVGTLNRAFFFFPQNLQCYLLEEKGISKVQVSGGSLCYLFFTGRGECKPGADIFLPPMPNIIFCRIDAQISRYQPDAV